MPLIIFSEKHALCVRSFVRFEIKAVYCPELGIVNIPSCCRLSLRLPLVRLYQELETFRYRAISDTAVTVERMEGYRSEYRAGLLWMAEVSKELDPDVNKRLDKFRDVSWFLCGLFAFLKCSFLNS